LRSSVEKFRTFGEKKQKSGVNMQVKMPTAEMVDISLLKPYKKNTKKHNQTQIDNVSESIRKFGFVQPFVIDKNNEVIIGHCRLLAAQKLGITELPCVRVDYLTAAQVKALRILDNKLNESEWDLDFLNEELPEIDLTGFDVDFDFQYSDEQAETDEQEYERRKAEFAERMASGELSEDSKKYQEFLAKFEPKKTTDDCYTPELVYDSVAKYVSEKYGLSSAKFVRPFYPGGDYAAEKYAKDEIVVDNPPFSLLSEIVRFYVGKKVKFFLFAPTLTLFATAKDANVGRLVANVAVTYANGANVNTSFITNLEMGVRSAPDIYQILKKANNENLKSMRKELPKYSYPLEVVTAPQLGIYSRLGIEFGFNDSESVSIARLDNQKEVGKSIYGSGYLISENKRAERERAERERAERERAERERVKRWELSEREKRIIATLK